VRQHASQRFQAPNTILHGVPLKEVLGKDLVRLIGESFADVHSGFDRKTFQRRALDGLETLELAQRARHIGLAIAEQLPRPFAKACPILLASLGPELTKTAGNGLATFFYQPHGHIIVECGLEDFENAMRANYELTKRDSAEFSIRPFLAKYRDQCLDLLIAWCRDPNPHVRRLVSEGTRPRLPWAMRLKEFQQNPQLSLPLLEQLKDDPELYVRRSVANHLGDILKDHPEVGFSVCERWLKEVGRKSSPTSVTDARKWIIRHAVRLPAKKADPRALLLRQKAK
jgi:3-methyladenine DNA glycosylase AlkC